VGAGTVVGRDEPRGGDGAPAMRAGDRAYAAILDRILSGHLPPGERLREEELSAAVGVSRTPVREALHRLAADGLIDFMPNRGAQVRTWDDGAVEEIFEVRALLEGRAASRAARHIGQERIEELEQLAVAMESHLGSPVAASDYRIARLNSDFHRIVIEESRSALIETLMQGVSQVALMHRTFMRYTPRELERSFSHHRELIEALSAGDPEWSESIMRNHLLSARDIVMARRDHRHLRD
jgi:DNA-binding GntR family transcriptional regulator